MNETATDKKKRFRSPSYPAVDLATAIDKARVIYEHERKSAAPVAVVARHWGTDIKSSTGLRLVAALKQFGLLLEEGRGEDRHVRLSDLALDILLPNAENPSERRRAIKAAALAPKIHRTLWDQYAGKLPSDETLKTFLVRKMEFHDTHVQGFIKQFRATIEFAELEGAEHVHDQEESEANGSAASDPILHDSAKRDAPMAAHDSKPITSQPAGGPYIVFPLSDGNVLEIRLRKRVSPKDFERIRQLVDLSEGSLVDFEERQELS